jgi:hypothetical protein
MLYPTELRAQQNETEEVFGQKEKVLRENRYGITDSVRRVVKIGRGERIRTSDILLPKQARYRAALRPD